MSNQLTEVRLMSVPLESDYKHTIAFKTKTQQTEYFHNKTLFKEEELSYQRKEKYISFPRGYDEICHCNYLSFLNVNENNRDLDKIYYAFITRMEYKGDKTTWIYFEIDVMQTYLNEYTIKPSFVEREHVDNDTIGAHTLPENLEVGDYVIYNTLTISDLQAVNIVVGVSRYIENGKATLATGAKYNGVYSGIHYYSFPLDNTNGLSEFITSYSSGESISSDDIKCMFLAPNFLSKRVSDEDINHYTSKNRVIQGSSYSVKEFHYANANSKATLHPGDEMFDIADEDILSSIHNNKLHCFPYNYLLVSNNNGGSAIYHFEHFKDNGGQAHINFTYGGALTPGCSIRLVPVNYKGTLYNEEEGLTLGKYAICNWVSDEYTNWLTQNGVNIGIDIATGVGQVIAGGVMAGGTGGLATGGGLAVAAGGVSKIAGTLAQIHTMSFTSPQARGNLNSGDYASAAHTNTFSFHHMGIKSEYVKILDRYFDLFGYKVNEIKEPNKFHRENWWYTKTIDVNIDGQINVTDIQTIKNCYNNGITFWRDPENVGNYTFGLNNNRIVFS